MKALPWHEYWRFIIEKPFSYRFCLFKHIDMRLMAHLRKLKLVSHIDAFKSEFINNSFTKSVNWDNDFFIFTNFKLFDCWSDWIIIEFEI